MKLLLSLLMLCIGYKCYAQTIQTTTTAATCKNNGTITVSVTGMSGLLEYSLIAPSKELRDPQSSNLFQSLEAGTYTVEVTNGSQTLTKPNVVIADQYTRPEISRIVPTRPTCPGGNDGKALVKTKTNATATPFNYYLYDSAGTSILQGPVQSPIYELEFTGLNSGIYIGKVVDACGIESNYQFTVPVKPNNFRFTINNLLRNCSDTDATIRLFNAKYPVNYTIYDDTTPTSTGTLTANNQPIKLPNKRKVRIVATDACGITKTLNRNELKPRIRPSHFLTDCNEFTLKAPLNRTYSCPANSSTQYCYQKKGTSGWNCGTTETFTQLPEGTYNIRVTDCCGIVINKRNYTIGTPTPTLSIEKLDYSCLDETTSIKITLTDFTNNTVLKYTGGNLVAFNTSLDNGAVTLNPTLNINDIIPVTTASNNSKTAIITNLPAGTYTFSAEEQAGGCNTRTDSKSITIIESDLNDYDIQTNIIQGCKGQSKIQYGLSSVKGWSANNQGPTLRLFRTTNNTNTQIDSYTNITANTLRERPNLIAGTYRIEFEPTVSAEASAYACPSTLVTQNVTIQPYTYPNLTKSKFYTCGDNTETVVAGVENGAAPFLYSIRRKGAATFGSPRSNNVFTGLNPSNVYEIQVRDACGNNSIKEISAEGILNMPQISGSFNCFNNTNATRGVLSVNEVIGAQYEWKDETDTVIGNTRELELSALQTGKTYTITVSIPGRNNQSCIVASNSATIETTSCLNASILPVELTKFTGYKIGETIQLIWKTANEQNHQRFEIQRSQNGLTWQTIGSTIENGDSSSEKRYQFGDTKPNNGLNYYRLVSISTNGEKEFSKILSFQFDTIQKKSIVLKNPIQRGEDLFIQLGNPYEEYHIQVYSSSGQFILDQNIFGRRTAQIPTNQLSKGLHLLIISKKNSEKEFLKFIIN